MTISRRQLLGYGGLAGAAALGGAHWTTASTPAFGRIQTARPLNIPPILEGRVEGATKVFDLAVQAGRTEFLSGIATPTIGVNGAFLGPTLKLRAGDRVVMNVANNLAEHTTLHWHGLHVPAKADGGPHQVVGAGKTWSPAFEIKQKAAMFWYHSHLMGKTGDQVNRGLAGLMLVEDDESAALGLPSEYGVDDIPLVVQDRRFNAGGTLDYIASMHDVMMGFKGDTLLVNGTVRPFFKLRRDRTRLRLLNGSNSRIYRFGFDDNRSFMQVATDGSLLPAPVRRRRVRLAPGERAEILVEATPDSRFRLMSYPDTGQGGGMMGGMMRGMVGNNDTFEVLELRSGRLEKSGHPVPQRLSDVPDWQPGEAQRTRVFELDMPMMGGMMGMMRGRGMMGGGRDNPSSADDLMAINGRSMDMRYINERVPSGAVEIWEIRNDTPLAHPFHIHDVQFRILDRNGAKPAAHERGLKDTVLVDSGEVVRVITRFGGYADSDNPYMYHCHILEHEDAGMMGQFVVTA